MFPPLRRLDWVYEDAIESMENGQLDTLKVNFEYLSGEGHDACGWMAVEGWIWVNVPPLSLRLDSRSPFTVLCPWFVEGWSVDTLFLR